MAELTETKSSPAVASDCCAPEHQADCCEPSEKAACCSSESSSCGCSAGETSGEETREAVRRYAAATMR
jgi:arsenite methyltransferase